MMAFMVEIVITAFAFGGILGAVVALHLSTHLKQTEDARKPTGLNPVPVDITSRRADSRKKHHH